MKFELYRKCPTCKGAKTVKVTPRINNRWTKSHCPNCCPECMGKGEVSGEKCHKCSGKGWLDYFEGR